MTCWSPNSQANRGNRWSRGETANHKTGQRPILISHLRKGKGVAGRIVSRAGSKLTSVRHGERQGRSLGHILGFAPVITRMGVPLFNKNICRNESRILAEGGFHAGHVGFEVPVIYSGRTV